MQCPICKNPVDDDEVGKPGSTYPFCSDRCRLIDLGRWLSGKYQIHTSKDEADASDWDDSPAPAPDQADRRDRRAHRDAGDA
jgi:endogenous inhibitor of DNA gyrase (YacG/DUF329 family)